MPALVRLEKHLAALPLKSLVGMALQETDLDSDTYWKIMCEMRCRANPQTLQMAQKLFQTRNWRNRVLAVNIICQMGSWDNKIPSTYQPYAVKEAQEMLLAAINDTHAKVVIAAIFGLGHRAKVDALPNLLPFFKHKNVEYRRAAVFALSHYGELSAIDALLALAADNDDDVRDWATFALGSLRIEADTPDLRERLWLNSSDENLDIAGEALVGLAIRKDPRVHDLILKRLEKCDPMDCFIQEAVHEMDCPELSQKIEEGLRKLKRLIS